MSTANFTASDAALQYGGYWVAATFIRPAMEATGNDSTVEFSFGGTELQMKYQFSASSTVSIDGASAVSIADNSGSLNQVTLATGLSDTVHTAKITGSEIFIDAAEAFQVTGANPSLSAPANWGTNYGLTDPAFGNYIAIEGAMLPADGGTAAGYPGIFLAGYGGAGVRFRGNPAAIDFWCAPNGATFTILQDNVVIFTSTLPSGTGFGFTEVINSLDTSAAHLYEIVATDVWGHAIFVWSMRLHGGVLDQSVTIAAREVLVTYGNSITVGAGATPANDVTKTHSWLLARSMGLAFAELGEGGTTVKYFSDTKAGEHRTGQVTQFSAAVKAVVLEYGINDEGQVGGAETPSDFQTSATNMLTLITGGIPSTVPIVYISISSHTTNTDAETITWNTALQAAIAAVAASNLKYLDLQSSIPTWNQASAASFTSDGLHWNNSTYSTIAGFVLPLISPQSATTTILPCFLGRFGMFSGILASVAVTVSLYFRPDGTSKYLRPDGTSFYQRP